MCPRRGCLRILVIYYTQAMCRNISSLNEMITKSAQLRLGDFIQPKNCKILKSGGDIFCVLNTKQVYDKSQLNVVAGWQIS